MKLEDARELFETIESNYSTHIPNRVLKGMLLIQHSLGGIEVDTYLAAEHDQIYFGDFISSVEFLNEEKMIILIELGWFEDKDNEMWTHFV